MIRLGRWALPAAAALALTTVAVPATAQRAPAAPPAALERPAFPFFPLQPAFFTRAERQTAAPPATDGVRYAVPFATGELWLLDVATGLLIVGKPLPSTFAPVFAGPGLLVTGDAVLDAVRATDLEPVWRTPLPAKAAYAPLARDGWAFLHLADGALLALRTDTGKVVWRVEPAGGPVVPPCVEGDRLYAGATGALLVSREVATGGEVWRVTLDRDVTALAAVEGHVFAATAGRWLYALDAKNGRVRWRYRIGGAAIGLAVDEDRVIAVMLDQSVRAFKIGSGAQAWRQTLSFRPAGGPVVAGASVLVTGFAPAVRVIDRRTGVNQGLYEVPLPPDSGGATLETLAAGPVFQTRATLFDDLLILITQRGWIHGMRRLFDPPATPIAALPGGPLPAPEPPPGWVEPEAPPPPSPGGTPAAPAGAAPSAPPPAQTKPPGGA